MSGMSMTIGLVAHDDRKATLVQWAQAHAAFLADKTLYAIDQFTPLIEKAVK